MASHIPNTYATNGRDWSQLIVKAMLEGGQAFLTCISSAAPDLEASQLLASSKKLDQQLTATLRAAKRSRNVEQMFLAAARLWSRKQATLLLVERANGTPLVPDFYSPFEAELHLELEALATELQTFWEQEDEQRERAEQQRIAARREAEEAAFGSAYTYIRGLNDAVLGGERQRRSIFDDGQRVAQAWADRYGESVQKREEELTLRAQRLQEQEQLMREHQLALRTLATWDDKRSFVDTVVSTGKNTIGCLVLWLLLVGGILLAIYFAFPHHP